MVVGEEDGQTETGQDQDQTMLILSWERDIRKNLLTLIQHDSEGVKRESTKVHSAISGELVTRVVT